MSFPHSQTHNFSHLQRKGVGERQKGGGAILVRFVSSRIYDRIRRAGSTALNPGGECKLHGICVCSRANPTSHRPNGVVITTRHIKNLSSPDQSETMCSWHPPVTHTHTRTLVWRLGAVLCLPANCNRSEWRVCCVYGGVCEILRTELGALAVNLRAERFTGD